MIKTTLSDREKLIYNLRYNDDGTDKMSVKEISELLKEPMATISSTLKNINTKNEEKISQEFIKRTAKKKKNLKYKDILKNATKLENELGYRWHDKYTKESRI